MNTPVTTIVIAIALIAGSTVSIMSKACKSGYHAWCVPMSSLVRHHSKTRPPA